MKMGILGGAATAFRWRRLVFLLVVLACQIPWVRSGEAVDNIYSLTTDGPQSLEEGKKLFKEDEYEDASMYFWRAVLLQSQSGESYTVEEAFTSFMQCYAILDRTADGFVFIAKESMQRGQVDMATKYLEQALDFDPTHAEAREVQSRLESQSKGGARADPNAFSNLNRKKRTSKFQAGFGTPEADDPLKGKSPEDLYEYGSTLFSRRNYEHCADVFELSCRRSNYQLGPSCSNAVYCRSMVLDWGFNGTSFDDDMKRIIELTEKEAAAWRRGNSTHFTWNRATSVHPHMMLGYPIPPILKRYVSESVAFMDEKMARLTTLGQMSPLPDDMPFSPASHVEEYKAQAAEPGFKLKVGFVSSGFNSKAVLYLSQDIFRFYSRSKIEMHIFSLGPPDNDNFIKYGMRGTDWRKRVQHQVDHFHDVQDMKMDHVQLARFIHDQGIHVLIEWDGYARQGERAQGLMTLRPAPLQMLHQEYLGTSGATYVDYIFTDKVTSPPHLEHLYTEKFIYLPNHFFSKGHRVQNEVKPPTHEYLPKKTPHVVGTGTPQENKCMAGAGVRTPSFVYCNFNKFLKNNPETLRSWIRILREVPGSIFCLLENPSTGSPYLRRFVHEAAGAPMREVDKRTKQEYASFEPKDGDALNDRIHFLPWEKNPFDHQKRNQDFCNVMLDSFPYNGHTVAQDSLYGGVPIVTRSDGDDMSSRVTTSANIVLGLDEMNALGGSRDYEDIAIDLGRNKTKYADVRRRLIDTALQENPLHPYWDMGRYALNFEDGIMEAWGRFLAGLPPDHITVVESEEAKRGTFDDKLEFHPSDRHLTHDEL